MKGSKLFVRAAAVACIALSLPLSVVAFPWLPATIEQGIELRRESERYGSASYQEDRDRRVEENQRALTLYGLSVLSLAALGVVVLGFTPWWSRACLLLVASGTAFQVSHFWRMMTLSEHTAGFIVIIGVWMPFAIGVITSACAVLTLLESSGKGLRQAHGSARTT